MAFLIGLGKLQKTQMMKMLCVYSMKPDGAWREAASWSKMGARKGLLQYTTKVRSKKLHRTGIEPVPLAWKASMITTSPSVLYLKYAITFYITRTRASVRRAARLSGLVNPPPSCPFKRLAKARYGSQRIIQKDIRTYRLRFARPPPTIHGVPLAPR